MEKFLALGVTNKGTRNGPDKSYHTRFSRKRQAFLRHARRIALRNIAGARSLRLITEKFLPRPALLPEVCCFGADLRFSARAARIGKRPANPSCGAELPRERGVTTPTSSPRNILRGRRARACAFSRVRRSVCYTDRLQLPGFGGPSMQDLHLLPLGGASRRDDVPPAPHAESAMFPPGERSAVLRRTGEYALQCVPLPGDDLPDDSSDSDNNLVAMLRAAGAGDARVWYLIPRNDALGVNGIAPPLGLVQLDPGAVLSLGTRSWLVVSVQQSQPAPAPAELADRDCPVCGGKLSITPVVQCGCGRWTHLERPDEPDSRDALNCYLASAACPDCGRAATLQPQITPEPPEKLVPADESSWNGPI
jgi:hypothetical protein